MITLAMALTKRSVQAGLGAWSSTASLMSNRILASCARDRDVSVAAEGVQDAAQEVDFAGRDGARGRGIGGAQRPLARDDGVAHLFEREARKANGGPACLFDDAQGEFEIGLGAHEAVLRDTLDQPLGVVGGDVALRMGLEHQIIGDGFDVEPGPRCFRDTAGTVQPEHQIGFIRGDDAVLVKHPAEFDDVLVIDGAARNNIVDRQ